VCQRSVAQVGEDLLDDRVVAVLGLGLRQDVWAVGEHRVIAPAGRQFLLPGGLGVVQPVDTADDEPRGDRLVLLRREGGVADLGDLGVRYPGPDSSSKIALGYSIGVQAASSIAVIAPLTLGSIRAVKEKNASWRRHAWTQAAE
jgi:hypothetical protein